MNGRQEDGLPGPAADEDGPLDAVIVGYYDYDLQALMAARYRIRDSSAAFRQMLGSVFRHEGRWLHHSEFINAALQRATGRDFNLHPMELPNLAACYLQSYLSRLGFRVAMVNLVNHERGRLEALLRRRPRSVAITTTLYVESAPVADLVREVRRLAPDTRIVLGGPFIFELCSLPGVPAQDRLLADIGGDIYVHDILGEATYARVLERLRAPPAGALEDIPNLVIRRPSPGGSGTPAAIGFHRTARVPEDGDLDRDAMDWDRVDRRVFTPSAQMRISRSCPFDCAFCRYPAIAGASRRTALAVIESEMRQLHAAGVRTLIFVDDTPNVPVAPFKEMLRMMIRNRFEFHWFSNLRCAQADAEAFDLMKASGCQGVFLGIESGDQSVLDNMNKRATLDKYREGIRQLRARGILTYASFIIGFPGETPATAANTRRFIQEAGPDYYQLHVYYHSREVPIHRRAAEFGLRGGDYSWRHATMDWRQACDLVDETHAAITTSIRCTSYLSTFWLLAYLYGKGVSLPNIAALIRACGPALARNRLPAHWESGGDGLDAALVAAARAAARDLDRGVSGSR